MFPGTELYESFDKFDKNNEKPVLLYFCQIKVKHEGNCFNELT